MAQRNRQSHVFQIDLKIRLRSQKTATKRSIIGRTIIAIFVSVLVKLAIHYLG